MEPPETRYAASPGGLIAYQVVGDGPVDLVSLAGSTGNVDVRWESPAIVRLTERMASFSRVIVFDRRGTGMSDAIPLDELPTWEDWADDLRIVLDAVGSERAVLYTILDAGPMGMLFAATHPDRVRGLILGNTTARFMIADDYPSGLSDEAAAAITELAGRQWGTEEYARLVNPKMCEDPRARKWFAKYMRASATPRVVEAQLRALLPLDLRDILPTIRVPTLVLHRRDWPIASIEHGRYLAEHIPDARLVELPGSDSAFIVESAEQVLDAIEEFVTGTRPMRDPDRVLATVLFTDLVDSTGRAAELGDRRWRALLDRHDEMARAEIDANRGRLMKTTGDGVLATFDAPGRAIRCTMSLREALSEIGLEMRAGLHTGEIELRDDDVGGIAVHIAARVAALAGPSEILVSRTVSDLVAGSEIGFTDRGGHALKGIPGEWQLWAVA
ncbi:MAG: alpha/beta fold hydrolase [Actinomycetota bacterium]